MSQRDHFQKVIMKSLSTDFFLPGFHHTTCSRRQHRPLLSGTNAAAPMDPRTINPTNVLYIINVLYQGFPNSFVFP